MPKQICILCGHEWESRLVKPRACPRCKRYDYRGDTFESKKVNIQELLMDATRPESLDLNTDDITFTPDCDMDPDLLLRMINAREKLSNLKEINPQFTFEIPDD